LKRLAPSGPGRAALGADKERLAADFLVGHGLRLLEQNYRCRQGELDLVMRDGGELVFVEVRYRACTRFGHPAETVDVFKQRRLTAAAGHYLQRHPSVLPCRFDVIAVTGQDRIEWIRNAFDAVI
jgi:putative endonuclease